MIASTSANALTVDDATLKLNSGTTYNGGAARTISVKDGGIDSDALAADIEVTSLTAATITVTNMTVTSLTSSIVTSSILQTEGSNIFGDATADTHLFNGHLTGSANISASGTIIANAFTGTFNGAISGSAQVDHDSTTNFVANEHIDHSAVSVIAGTGLTGGGTIAANRTLNVVGGTGVTANANDIAIGQDVATTAKVSFAQVTASSNISSSGTITANSFTGTFTGGVVSSSTQINSLIDDTIAATIVAEIDNDEIPIAKLAEDAVTVTAGTNLSNGGTVTLGGSITLNVDDAFIKNDADDATTGILTAKGLVATTNITASSNISASGTITAKSFTGTFIGAFSGSGQIDHDSTTNFVANEHIDHSGVSITAGTGLTGGGTIASTRTLNVIGGTGVTANANDIAIGQDVATTADVQFNHITSSGNISSSANIIANQITASGNTSFNGTVGIGTASPTQQLDVREVL